MLISHLVWIKRAMPGNVAAKRCLARVRRASRKIEGSWETEQLLIGFHLGDEIKDIRLPEANIVGAYLTLHRP